MSTPVEVVVVGGGIAGLAAAFELVTRGVRCQVIERAGRPGGLIRTDRFGRFTIDAGPDALLVQKPAAVALCREIGLGSRLLPTQLPRTAYIVRQGALYPLPEASILGIPTEVRALASTRLFSLAGKIRMAAELFVPRRDPNAPDEESIGAFVRRRFGSEAVAYLAEPLLAGIHAGDVDRLSMRALFPRFLDAEQQYGSILRAFRAMGRPRSESGAFLSLPEGLEEMVQAIVSAFPAGVLRCACPVHGIEGRDPYVAHLATGETLAARAVIIATPAYVTADVIQGLDADLAALCRLVPYASTATVALGYRREAVSHPLAGSGFVVPRTERLALLAGSWVSSKWPGRAPDGHVLLRAFFGGARDPGMLSRDDRELARTAHLELSALLDIRGEPVFSRVYRWERAHAQHELGHLERVAAIDRRLARWPGLYVTGSGFRGVGIADCVADARATAAAAAALLRQSPQSA